LSSAKTNIRRKGRLTMVAITMAICIFKAKCPWTLKIGKNKSAKKIARIMPTW